MIKHFCDKCGKETKPTNKIGINFGDWWISGGSIGKMGGDYDKAYVLCIKCIEEIAKNGIVDA